MQTIDCFYGRTNLDAFCCKLGDDPARSICSAVMTAAKRPLHLPFRGVWDKFLRHPDLC
jgi:hypothetical protein